MRLAALLAELPSEQLEHLAVEHLGEEQAYSRATLCTTLEGVLRSFAFVRDFVVRRQPPAFAILDALLDSPNWAVPLAGFREKVTGKTQLICERVSSGEIAGRDDQLRLYRRVLTEARRSDLEIDPSEAALLGVLRRELRIRQVEHFLLEHHPDLQRFWNTEHAFLNEMNALRTTGLVFVVSAQVVLADEVVPLVRQTLGLEMPEPARRRLYSFLSGIELGELLGALELRTSGSRDEKFERLVINYVQPSEVLQLLQLGRLRDLCRDSGAAVSGSKDELVDRLIEHFLYGIDEQPASEVPRSPEPEPKMLDARRFQALFTSLRGYELTDVLAGIESSRLTGAKDVKVTKLWESPFSEATLLGALTSRCIEGVLDRHALKTSGSKRDRIERLVEHFRELPEEMLVRLFEDSGELPAEDAE